MARLPRPFSLSTRCASIAAAVTIGASGVVAALPVLAAPPETFAPALVLPTNAEIAAFYAPFNEKIAVTAKNVTEDERFYNAGVNSLNVSDYRMAGANFTQALAVRPKFSDANFNRGLASEGLKKWDFAIVDFTAVLTTQSRFYDAYVERARCYKMLGDMAKARADAEAAKAIHPEREDIYELMGDPRPDLSLSPDLTPLRNYALQLPKGYVKSSLPVFGDIEDVSESAVWTGTARSDGSRPFIAFAYITPPAIAGKTWTTEDVLANVVLRLRRSRSGWSQASIQNYVINGVLCAYATWSGKGDAAGAATRGLGYVAPDGDRFVYVFSQDTEPDATDSLAKMTASARTLRKIN